MFESKQFFNDRLSEVVCGVAYSHNDIDDVLKNNEKYVKEIALLGSYVNIYLYNKSYVCWCCRAYCLGYFGPNKGGLIRYCFVICPASEYCKRKCLTHNERISLAKRIVIKQLKEKYPDIENWLP